MVADALRVVSLQDGERGLRLEGELDMATVPLLLEALEVMRGDGQVRLDLSGLTFMDSSGLHAIVQFAAKQNGNGRLILDRPSRMVSTIFKITDLADHPQIEIRFAGEA